MGNHDAYAESIIEEINNLLQEIANLTTPSEMPRRIEACQKALELVPRSQYLEHWAGLHVELGKSFVQSPQGQRSENIENAIYHYEKAFEGYTPDAFPRQWAETQNELGLAYYYRVEGMRTANIDRAIDHYKQALQIFSRKTLPEHWATTQNNLAIAFRDRINGTRTENIDSSIHHGEQALKVYSRAGFPYYWAAAKNNLALAYYDRPSGVRAENVERAIKYYKQAKEVISQGNYPENWASIQNNLGLAYVNRIYGKQGKNIEQAIFHYRKALEVRTYEDLPRDWAMTLNNLAIAYRERIQGRCDENIDTAIECLKQALKVYTPKDLPEKWAWTQENLANAYRVRNRGKRHENIERAIRHFEQALKVRTRKNLPAAWAASQCDLANVYCERIQGDRAENIEQAIRHYLNALEVFTREDFPVEWSMTQNNLATAYEERIREEKAENIERAIFYCKQALEVRTRENAPNEWADTQNNLATVFRNRIRGKRAQNIERAIQHYEQALKVRTRKDFPADWAMTMNNLAIAYSKRILGEIEENIEHAISLYEQALEVYTRKEYPFDWAMTNNNLANVYRDRIKGDPAENIERAVQNYKQSLEVRTRSDFPFDWAMAQNNLANAYRDRVQGRHDENIEKAIHHYEQALEVFNLQTFPEHALVTFRNLAILCLEKKRWSDAVKAFSSALEIGDWQYKMAVSADARQATLREVRGLAARLSFALSQTQNDLQEAVVAMERSRARWLREALSLTSDRSPEVPESLWRKFIKRGEKVRELQAKARLPEKTPGRGDFLTITQELREAYAELDQTIEDIRRYDVTFIPEPKFDQILSVISNPPPGKKKSAIVYFAMTPSGSLALVVSNTEQQEGIVSPVWFPLLTDEQLEDKILRPDADSSGYLNAYDRWRSSPGDKDARSAWLATLEQTTRWLWEAIMGPLTSFLSQQGIDHAVLFPQGWLSFLPLHAACTETQDGKRRYAIDEICFTYAPNALAMARSQNSAEKTPETKLFAVDEPYSANAGPLPNSSAEVAAVCSYFTQRQVLSDEDATWEETHKSMPGNNVFHFSCHGIAGYDEPFEGGLFMANDRKLTLSDILSLRLENARLAVLSACETGVPGIELPDEAISLPSGLLQAGIQGIVASHWAVSDLSTMMLMTRFYELWRKENLIPMEALRQAQIWIRDTTNSEKAAYFKEFLPEVGGERIPTHVADMLYKNCIMAQSKKTNYQHPYFWAAFGYTGS